MSNKVLVTGTSVARCFLEPLNQAGCTVVNPAHLLSEEELRTELADARAYLLGGDEFVTKAALADANNLAAIAFLGVGYETFMDVAAVTDRDGL